MSEPYKFADGEIHTACMVAVKIAEKLGYQGVDGTAMIERAPTEAHPDTFVVGVHASVPGHETLHVILRIVETTGGRKLRKVDVHPGSGAWGGSLICATCDKYC